jgi:hypothetical protein
LSPSAFRWRDIIAANNLTCFIRRGEIIFEDLLLCPNPLGTNEIPASWMQQATHADMTYRVILIFVGSLVIFGF